MFQQDSNVAVLICLYKNDSCHLVQQALKSILIQTFRDYDIYILCDGPVRSDVQALLMDYDSENFHVIKRDVNRGLAVSLNELLKMVLSKKYEYIFRMDADDISLPTRFEMQIIYMKMHPEIDCLGTWAIEIDTDENEYFRKKMPMTHEECLKLFIKRDCMIHPTVLFRRSYFEKAGLYPEDTYFGEDTMMWAKGFKNGCHFANLPEYLFKFRLDENFFRRRRGWKHAISIFILRRRVNKMLDFGFKADCYAFLYAMAKMMPTRVLNFIYRRLR